MKQHAHDVLAEADHGKYIELLDRLAPADRFNAHVPQGTYFLTTSGKVSVERLRSGMTVIDGEGGHRAVIWCKHTDSEEDRPVPHSHRRSKTDLHTSRTRFPVFDPAKTIPSGPPSVDKYWVVLSQAFAPVKKPIAKYDHRTVALSFAHRKNHFEFGIEPEIINIFADYDGPQPSVSHGSN